MMYYCGWDGGGTKTSVCITDPCGEVLAEGAFGPVNPNGTETEVVQSTVRDCISFMASQPGGLDAYGGLVVGFAGVSNHKAVAIIENAIRGGGFHGNLLLIGDHEIALAGALEGPGAILIAGTGSICFCRNTEGKTYRSGGYGYLIDDEGSGYALGRDILSAVVRAADGRGPATILTQVVYQQLQKLPHVQVGAPLHNAAWGAAKLARETFQPEL